MDNQIFLKTSEERYYDLLKILINPNGTKQQSQTIHLFKKQNVTSTNLKSSQLISLVRDDETKLKEQLLEKNKKTVFVINKNKKENSILQVQEKLQETTPANTKLLSLLNQSKKKNNLSQKKYKIRKPSKLNREQWESKFLNETASKTRMKSERNHLRTLTHELQYNPKIIHYKKIIEDDPFQRSRSSMKIANNNNGVRQISDTTVDLNQISKTQKFLTKQSLIFIKKPIQSTPLAKIQRKGKIRRIATQQNQKVFELKQKIQNKFVSPIPMLGNLLKTVTIDSKQIHKFT